MPTNSPNTAWFPDKLSLVSSRSSRTLRVLGAASIIAVLFNLFYFNSNVSRAAPPFLRPGGSNDLAAAAAGNSTLGFSSIQFINLKHRYDRGDAGTLQAYLSGLDIAGAPGVESVDIHDAGMPPTHRKGALQYKEKATWRAHANVSLFIDAKWHIRADHVKIWSQVLRTKAPAVLIIEADAAWDLNIREIMSNMNQHFTLLLQRLNSTPVHSAEWGSRSPLEKSPEYLRPNPDDPWHVRHWDMLSLGQCFESGNNNNINDSIIYPDKHMTKEKDYYGRKLHHERVIRVSGGIVCTTAYAISQTGAAKLLLRSAVDLDNPVDLLMRRMIMSGDLITYSVMPTIFAQWEYVNHIGMRQYNSDIKVGQSEEDSTGWTTVQETGSVWRENNFHPDIAFENMALEKAWGLILQGANLKNSLYDDKTGN
ncbi:hypothetical protein QQS21_009110 [Conoideocrella luteorostrata]|uniref:Glycosyltransferase family 25 protein n=1 Tax=Conoideocrella luteorostrata TaxID=1105319 RepID=A0AAJ0CLY4_9HYPO|nr:hypothetical protein QQS21_009110 [Conoideocrella luteorostrata]